MQRFTKRSTNWGTTAFLVCLTIGLFAALSAIGHLTVRTALVAIGATALIDIGRRMKISELQTRLSEKRDMKWMVRVNDIPVGELDDEHIARISLDALLDARNYVAQATHVTKFLIRFALVLFIAVPCSLVWIGAASALFAPAALASALHSISGADLSNMMSTLGMIVLEFSTIFFGTWIVFAGRIGFKDAFAEDRSRRLRVMTNTSAVGSVTLIPR
jgi:hypothetical protein